MAPVTATEFARIVGYDRSQVATWRRDGLPCEGSGRKGDPVRIELDQAIPWLLALFKVKRTPSGSTTVETARLRSAQAERAEIENAVRRGELISKDDITHALQALIVTLTQKLDGMASQLSVDVETRNLIRNATRRARDETVAELRQLDPT